MESSLWCAAEDLLWPWLWGAGCSRLLWQRSAVFMWHGQNCDPLGCGVWQGAEEISRTCRYTTGANINGLVQERRNSIANALELRLSGTNPSIWNGACRCSCWLGYYPGMVIPCHIVKVHRKCKYEMGHVAAAIDWATILLWWYPVILCANQFKIGHL